MAIVVPIIAAVAAAAASYGTAAGVTGLVIGGFTIGTTAAAVIGSLVGAVVALGVSYLGSALLGTSSAAASSAAATNRSQQIRQAAAPHQIILGSVKVSGVIAYLYSPNDGRSNYSSAVKGGAAANYQPNELLYSVVVLAGEPSSNVPTVDV